MATYDAFMELFAAMDARITKTRASERSKAIAGIRELMRTFGIPSKELATIIEPKRVKRGGARNLARKR